MTNFTLNLSNLTSLQEAGNPFLQETITKSDILMLCGALENADQQILNTVIVSFVLIILASVWYGVVRGKGGLRQKILMRWGGLTEGNEEVRGVIFVVQLLDGLILPGAAFSLAIALAQLLLWA